MLNTNAILLVQLKKWLGIILIIAIIGEIIFFPSLQNILGCVMAAISYGTFMYFLKRKYILMFPFSFMMFLSMFLYRYLPLIATIFEFKPITYGFERPIETFLFETFLFLFSTLAFYLACNNKVENNFIQKTLYKMSFYKINKETIWVLGIIGLSIRLYNFSTGEVEYGDVTGKFLIGLDYLMYAPLTLFFSQFLRFKQDKTKILIFYSAVILILNIASNSRRQIIIPIGIYALLYFIYAVKNNIDISKKLSTIKIVFLIVFFVFGLNLLTDLSLAMLANRTIRKDISKTELFQKTLETFQDDNLMKTLRSEDVANVVTNNQDYSKGWTEDYVDNFLLNRYANMRITDETLYYADKFGYDNQKMKKDLGETLLLVLPTPIIDMLGFHLDKLDHEFSRGDFLYGRGFGGYRVTSHVGDGLATFGYFYFLLQFITFFFIFKLLNCLVFFTKFKIIYSPFALFNVFTFLGMFRNANGIALDVTYCLRGFWQGCVTYLVVFYIARAFVLFLKKIKLID